MNLDLLRFVVILIPISTFLVCLFKWWKTKDVGFILLCICILVIPFSMDGLDFFAKKAVRSAMQTGTANFLLWKIALDKMGNSEKGTLNPLDLFQWLLYLRVIGGELIKLVFVLLLCRISIIHFRKREQKIQGGHSQTHSP